MITLELFFTKENMVLLSIFKKKGGTGNSGAGSGCSEYVQINGFRNESELAIGISKTLRRNKKNKL